MFISFEFESRSGQKRMVAIPVAVLVLRRCPVTPKFTVQRGKPEQTSPCTLASSCLQNAASMRPCSGRWFWRTEKSRGRKAFDWLQTLLGSPGFLLLGILV